MMRKADDGGDNTDQKGQFIAGRVCDDFTLGLG